MKPKWHSRVCSNSSEILVIGDSSGAGVGEGVGDGAGVGEGVGVGGAGEAAGAQAASNTDNISTPATIQSLQLFFNITVPVSCQLALL